MSERSFTNHDFQRFLAEHKLMGTRCQACDELFLPPRPLCPACYGETEWVALSGRGKLAAFTTVHIGLTRMIEAGYDRKTPYCTGIVELEEGPRMSAQILGVDATRPGNITIGTPLTAAFVERGDGEEKRTVLAFTAGD